MTYSLLHQLLQLQTPPSPYTPGEPHFWTDPHIARQMLSFHLDPTNELASRPPETIQRIVDWLLNTLPLHPGDAVLDLGCGPGLYASRLAQAGLRVTGVDFSPTSIDYAVQSARLAGLQITYRCQNYLELEDESQYDATLLIYGDFCPLSPTQRASLLARIHRALKPGGCFVLDVTTPHLRRRFGLKNGWHAVPSGFWKPNPHLVLEHGFAYPGHIYLDQYIVVEDTGKISVYRNWFQDYTPKTIRAELSAGGFHVESIFAGLTGAPYHRRTGWLGVIARKLPL